MLIWRRSIRFLISVRSWVQINWLHHRASNHILRIDGGSYSSIKEVGFKTLLQTVILQILHVILLESTFFATFPLSHSAVSGSDRTTLMCDTRDRGALHAADSLTRIACERARTCNPWTFMSPTFNVWERVFSPLPAGCNQLMWKHIVCNHVTDRSHFIYSAGWATPAITQHWEEWSPLFTPQHSSHSILFSSVSKPKQPVDSEHMDNL